MLLEEGESRIASWIQVNTKALPEAINREQDEREKQSKTAPSSFAVPLDEFKPETLTFSQERPTCNTSKKEWSQDKCSKVSHLQALCMQEQVYSGEQGQPQHLQGRLSLHINICLSKQKQM